MYLIKHSLKNIVRNKGRYLLIGAVFIVMLASITVSAMIHFTTNIVIDDYANRFGANVYFTPDLRKLLELGADENGLYAAPEISTEQLIAFSNSDALKTTLFKGSRQTYGEQIKGLDQGGEEADPGLPGFEAERKGPSRQAPNTVVLGYSDFSMIEDFSLGLREMDEGTIFVNPGECIISRDFADLNSLSVHDTIVLKDVNTEVSPLILTVCGIYNDITAPQPNGSAWAVNNRRNEILTCFSTFEQTTLEGVYVTAVYYLKKPGLAPQFEEYVRSNGLPEVYNLNTDADNYNQVVKPVEGLKGISITFLVIVLCFGSLVLVLLSMLGVRERKYEIGVLRAMGMEKGKVMFSLIMESLCVLLLCLIIGITVGSFAAEPVSDSILDKQIQLTEKGAGANYGDIVSTTASSGKGDYSALKQIDINLTLNVILFTSAIALLLGLFSSIASILYITRYEPMKILTERS